MKTEETKVKCPKCNWRGLKDELKENDGLCPICLKDLSYQLLVTKQHHLHRTIRNLLKKGYNPTEIKRIIGCSRSTVYKVVNKLG